MSEKIKCLIFSKDGKDIKWGIEVGDGWKVQKVYHKDKIIAKLYFGGVEEGSLAEGYSSRIIKINKEDKDKFWDEFSALTPEEQAEKDAWEKEQAAIKEKKELREKYEEEFVRLRAEQEEERYERELDEFIKSKIKGL